MESNKKRKRNSRKDELVNLIKQNKTSYLGEDFIPLSANSSSFSESTESPLTDLKHISGFKKQSDVERSSKLPNGFTVSINGELPQISATCASTDRTTGRTTDNTTEELTNLNEKQIDNQNDKEIDNQNDKQLDNQNDKEIDNQNDEQNDNLNAKSTNETTNSSALSKSLIDKSPTKSTDTVSDKPNESTASQANRMAINIKVNSKSTRLVVGNNPLIDITCDSESEEVIVENEESNKRISFCNSEESIDLNNLTGYNDFNKSDLIKDPDDSSSYSSYCEIVGDSNDVVFDPEYGCVQMNVNLNEQESYKSLSSKWSTFEQPIFQSKHKLINKSNISIVSKTIESYGKLKNFIDSFVVPSATLVQTKQLNSANLNKETASKSPSTNANPTNNQIEYNFEFEQANYQQPWLDSTKRYLAKGVVGLHEEINDFYEYSRLKPEEIKVRNFVFLKVKDVVLNKWPHARIFIFGSYQTGLSLPFADLDIVVFNFEKKIPFFALENRLIKEGLTTFEDTKVIHHASVPIIKFVHTDTGIHVDLSFNCSDGPKVINLIQSFKARYPTLARLLLIIKLYLHQRKLNFAYTGGLSSYSITLMVIAFYQQNHRKNASDENANLGVLLLEFFEFFGVLFNHKAFGIRVSKDGNFLKKHLMRCVNSQEASQNRLCIEDPMDLSNNPAKNSTQYEKVKKSFANAFNQLASKVGQQNRTPNCTSFLADIIGYTKDEVKQRKKVFDFHKAKFERPKGIKYGFDHKSDFIPFTSSNHIPDEIIDYDEYD